MFWNNVKIALRNLAKHKLFALMNVLGLAIGLVVFVFGNLLVRYEATHDAFFENAERVYTIGAIPSAELDIGVARMNGVFTAVGPLIEAELGDIELMARTINREYLVTRGSEGFYEPIRFADPELLQIFDFDYVHGDAGALDDPAGALLTESAAIRFFGETDVVGEVLTLDNADDFQVTAVIRDVARNSHFNSSVVVDGDFELVLPYRAFARMNGQDENGAWDNLSIGDMTYVLLPESLDGDWLQSQLDAAFERIVGEPQREVISGFWVIPLMDANLSVWDMLGLPVTSVIQLLSLLVLLVACVNYTNLATAQSLGRSREVGMRKTMGASQGQLLVQFLTESVVVAFLAMVVAVAILEVLIPLFNNATDKVLSLDYVATLPWLLATVLAVGIGAGLYPAWLITRATPIEALRDAARKGKGGARMRAVMIGAQFAISVFMLAIVSVVYMQNQKVQRDSYEFPRSEIYTLDRLNQPEIIERLDTLQRELEAVPNVDVVAFSSQVPYEQNNASTGISPRPGDEAAKINPRIMQAWPEFFEAYDIPFLAGRNLDRDVAMDRYSSDNESANIVINDMLARQLGYATPADAIGQRLYDLNEESTIAELVIVGVVPTQNITGLFNSLKPWMFMYNDSVRIASLRITGGGVLRTVQDVEDAWDRVIPEYPMQGRFLDDVFEDVYSVLRLMNGALAGFAFIALTLALIGLFGLAAFMATQRTKEIGVRKVLGASSTQIARLLVWQFSRPVMWALLAALPLAYLGTLSYLNFFAARIDSAVPILLVAGAIAVLLAWGTVAGHAIRIARANPVHALRYE